MGILNTEKFFNTAALVLTAVGTAAATALGGWDKWLTALMIMMALDYLTGLIKAIITKRLSSEIGLKGIGKKLMILVCVAVTVLLQNQFGIPLREVVLCFYLANEGISLLENLAEFIPVPQRLRETLLQLRTKNETELKSDGDTHARRDQN